MGYHGGYSWIKESIEGFKQLAKKYGYSHLRRIAEFIEVFKRKEDIFRIVGDASPIGIYKALKVLRELKQQEKKGSWKA